MSDHQPPLRHWALLGAVGAALAVAVVVGLGCSVEKSAAETPADSAESAAERAPLAVTAARVQVRSAQRSVPMVGTFSGFDEVTVAAKVSGNAVHVAHDMGDVVPPGEMLVEIDPTDYRLDLDEGLRNLELDIARLGCDIKSMGSKFSPGGPTVAELEAILRSDPIDVERLPTVVRAREQMENANSRYVRNRRLYEQNTLSKEDFESRETEYRVAVTALEQARMDGRALKVGLAWRLAQLKILDQKLRNTRVVVPTPTQRADLPSPVEYTVAQRKVTEGDMVKDSPNTSVVVFKLVMDTKLKLLANAPERFFAEVKALPAGQRQKALIRVEAYPDRVFEGEVTRVNPTVDRTSRTFQVEVLVPNAKRELKAGGFAKAEVLTRVDPQAWTVPAQAILSFAGTTKVFVIRDNKAHAVLVGVGTEGRDWVEIVRPAGCDLRADDQVITSSLNQLAEGVPVQIRN